MSSKKIEISEITFLWATSRPRLASKVTPSPHPGQGAYTGTLWDPLAKIAPGQVAGNSNLKFGVRPRPLIDKSRPSGTSACTPSHIRSRQMSRAVSLGFPWGSNVPDFELGYYGFRVGLLAENSPKPWVRPIPPSHASPAPAQRQPRGAWCRFSVTPRRQDTKRRANCKLILVVVKARSGCS